jgi:hypothetical protein
MPYSGLMPSIEAIQQAVREPLSRAPREHNAFAIYIFERARAIDHERALTKTLAEQREQSSGIPIACSAKANSRPLQAEAATDASSTIKPRNKCAASNIREPRSIQFACANHPRCVLPASNPLLQPSKSMLSHLQIRAISVRSQTEKRIVC